jgi:hypothetical protein
MSEAMKARGMPDWLIAHLIGIARIGNSGGFSTVEHETDSRHRQARAADDQAVRRGF